MPKIPCERCGGKRWNYSIPVDPEITPAGELRVSCKACGGSGSQTWTLQRWWASLLRRSRQRRQDEKASTSLD